MRGLYIVQDENLVNESNSHILTPPWTCLVIRTIHSILESGTRMNSFSFNGREREDRKLIDGEIVGQFLILKGVWKATLSAHVHRALLMINLDS